MANYPELMPMTSGATIVLAYPLMEKLLHYVWQQRLLPAHPLSTESGEIVDVINPGMLNNNAGPDFFNAKIKIGDTLWVGNVEIHERASDWYRHGHDKNAAYDNVVLHVCGEIDDSARTASGRMLPQVQLDVPEAVLTNYKELLAEQTFPPCYRVIPSVSPLTVHAWLNALTAERLEAKTQRIMDCLKRTNGDWERTAFITLARNFGFGINADAFEQWAYAIPLNAVGKHRDDCFQVEAFFMGQAGLLDENRIAIDCQDDYYQKLRREYAYLRHKFNLNPIDAKLWRFLRLRPQNFPYVRLAQLTMLYHRGHTDFSRIVGEEDLDGLRESLATSVTSYWQTHYAFGKSSAAHIKRLQGNSLDLLIINTVAPLRFAYGYYMHDESRCERAFALLEKTKAEHNFITRSWRAAGIVAENAADSQALIQLRHNYCDTKDCLRCRFGAVYLRKTKHIQ